MRSRLSTCSLIALFAAAILTLGPLRLHGQGDDLDSFDDARLDRDLEAELDDIYEDLAPDRPVALATLEEAILGALSDEDDDGDEDDISEAELEAEMEEAGTTLDACVEGGLEQADLLAAGQQPRRWTIALVSALAQQRGDGMTTPRLAVRQVKSAIRFDVRKTIRRE